MKQPQRIILSPKMQYILLFLIVIFGTFLRFSYLGDYPIGFHRDEAYLGYNGYSILQTGRDISNNFLPIHLKSFLNSPGGYSYFSIPFIYMFGLSEFSVRFASALFGSATIVLCFFLVNQLFFNFRFKKELALFSAFFLAITPWHVNLSRVATENVLVVFFITLGVLLYLIWYEKQNFYLLLLSFLSFGLTMTIYQAPRAFLPLFLPLLIFLYVKKPYGKNVLLSGLLLVLFIIIPTITILNSHALSERIRMLSIFQHPQTQLILDEQIREDGQNNVLTTRFFHNKLTNYSNTFLQNYFKHFSYDFLFTDAGLPDRYRISQMGLLYVFQFLLLIIGMWSLFSRERRIALFLAGWILLAPVGSALTFDDIPNLQRTLLVFPALAVIMALGFLEIWQQVRKIKFSIVLKSIFLLWIVYSVFSYLHQYYVHGVYHRPWYRQEGYKEMVTKVNQLMPNYRSVVVTDWESAPEIFFLFYGKYDSDKITFTHDECPLRQTKNSFTGEKNVLYVNHGTCKTPEEGMRTLAEIKRPDDTVVFKIETIE